jgi:hypothetical protein
MWLLLDGRAYTATELAIYADTSAPNMSMHLNKLVTAKLLSVEKQGRHRYYNFASDDISYAIEALANLLPQGSAIITANADDEPIRFCRTCYDHLAGKIGVMLADGLVNKGVISRSGTDFIVSEAGKLFFDSLGINVDALKLKKRSFARVCLDWSERKPHLAGSLGAALLQHMLGNHWIRTVQNSRAIIITGKGRTLLYEKLGITT